MRIASGHEIIVDDELLDKLPSLKGWFINSHGYAVRQTKVGKKRTNTYLHHYVLPPKKGFDIDHINRNKLDNRKTNLRYATRTQNIFNMGVKRNNTSGYKGVCWNKQSKKWRAYIGGTKDRKELGQYHDIKEAIRARASAESELVWG